MTRRPSRCWLGSARSASRQWTSASRRCSELPRRVVGEPAVDRAGLHDSAPRRGQPAEPHARLVPDRRPGGRRRPGTPPRSSRARTRPPRRRCPGRSPGAVPARRRTPPPRKSPSSQWRTTPTFTNSSRSIRGTHRSATYWNGSIGRGARAGGLMPPPPRAASAGAPRGARAGTRGRPRGRRPGRLDRGTARASRPARVRAPRRRASGVIVAASVGVEPPYVLGRRGEHVVGRVERLAGEPRRSVRTAGPRVVEVERGAVVDAPQVPVPHEQVRVAPGAVDVGRERVEPEHARGLLRLDPVVGVEAERAGQEVDAEVEARGWR